LCAGSGPEPAGSHPRSAECGDLGDESRDRLLDLGGSLIEVTLDSLLPYDHPCWGPPTGLIRDPRCNDDSTTSRSGRGAGWSEGLVMARSALRRRVLSVEAGPNAGFRCAYGDGP
jgi:hypothetical protein